MFVMPDNRQAQRKRQESAWAALWRRLDSCCLQLLARQRKAASRRLEGPEGSAEKARFTKRMRTAKGKTMGPRDGQIEARMRKRTEASPVSGKAIARAVLEDPETPKSTKRAIKKALNSKVTSMEGRASIQKKEADRDLLMRHRLMRDKTNKTAKEPVADFKLAAKLKKMEKESPSDMAPAVKAVLAQKRRLIGP